MAKLINQSCSELQLAVCLSRGDGTILVKVTRHSKNTPGNFQHQCLPELLYVNVSSHRFMVKSVS